MSELQQAIQRAQGKKIAVGFDGFIDTIVRPVSRSATLEQPVEHFATISDFGQYLVAHGGKSCSIALTVERRQLGGNLPHLSCAAGSLGLDVSCIGMLGQPEIDPIFSSMPCTLYSFAPAGQSTAFEFSDGKVFFAPDQPFSQHPWETVTAQVPQAPHLFAQADLIALVNWSELDFAQALWYGVYTDALEQTDFEKYAFFDLCDCTRRSAQSLDSVLSLIAQFSKKRTTVLSLNQNEAQDCGKKLLNEGADCTAIAQALRERYQIHQVLVHTIRETILVTSQGITKEATQFVSNPKISTGAGDHFNGASCFALLAGFSDSDRVRFANTYAATYIQQGYTPDLQQILKIYASI